MSHALYEILTMLDEARIWYSLHRTRKDAVLIAATLVGCRLDIQVSIDGIVEVSEFIGDESVDAGMQFVEAAILRERDT